MSSSSSHRRSKLRLHNYAGDFRSFKFFVLAGGEEGLESKIVIDPKLNSKRNPTGSYPALEIDESGELLFGDLSICRYVLATQHQQQRFSQPRTFIHSHTHTPIPHLNIAHTVDECWTEWASRDLQGAMVPHLNKFLFPERPGISLHKSSVYDLRNAFLKDEKVVSVRGVAQVLTQVLRKSSSHA